MPPRPWRGPCPSRGRAFGPHPEKPSLSSARAQHARGPLAPPPFSPARCQGGGTGGGWRQGTCTRPCARKHAHTYKPRNRGLFLAGEAVAQGDLVARAHHRGRILGLPSSIQICAVGAQVFDEDVPRRVATGSVPRQLRDAGRPPTSENPHAHASAAANALRTPSSPVCQTR